MVYPYPVHQVIYTEGKEAWVNNDSSIQFKKHEKHQWRSVTFSLY